MTRMIRPAVLLVDDEPHSLSAMKMALEDEFEIHSAGDAEQALTVLEREWIQVIFCDQRMPGRTGVELLTEMRERFPDVIRIIITGYTDAESMAAAINEAGIHQFLTKPWHPDQLMFAARASARMFTLARENERMTLEMRFLNSTAETRLEKRRRVLRDGMGFETILRAEKSPMNALVALAQCYASFDVPVLLTGEPGTGKAQLARCMHYGSLRGDKSFYALNLTGLPDEQALIELFGAKRGVLPGGVNKIGLWQKADRGTLFLNGVDTLSPALQMALLRVLTECSFSPIGGHEILTSNPRLFVGAHRDLAGLVAEGLVRPDLYYALSVTTLATLPLRSRPGDIALLAQHLLIETAAAHGKPVHGFDTAALAFLQAYDWPGNLRELANEVTRMLIMAQEPVLGAELISRHILQAEPGDDGPDRMALTGDGSLKDRVEKFEMRILRETLTRQRWNKSRAAAELGLSRVGLRAKLERYGVAQPGRNDVDEEEEN